MKLLPSTLLIALLGTKILAQDMTNLPSSKFPLWTGAAPGALGTAPKDIPTLTPFIATNGTGAAMIICPGGGYAGLAAHEGKDYALWLNSRGISAFVLKYRLGSSGYRYPAEYQDVARAIRLVRSGAKEW